MFDPMEHWKGECAALAGFCQFSRQRCRPTVSMGSQAVTTELEVVVDPAVGGEELLGVAR